MWDGLVLRAREKGNPYESEKNKSKKIIQEIMGKELEELGFKYMSGNSQFWSYVRHKDEIRQEIRVCHERFTRNYAKMYFFTNISGQKELEDFVPGILQESWKYETEEEFGAIIEQFKEWTFTYGLEELEKMSVHTTEVRPKPETNRYLYDHHEELNREYLKKLGVEESDTIGILFALQDRIEELKSQPFEEVEQELIGLAAVTGHCMSLYGIGEWLWEEEYLVCKVIGLGGGSEIIAPLAKTIASYKGTKPDNSFIKFYIDMLHFRNTTMRAANRTDELIDVEEVYEKIYEKRKERGEDV